MITLILDRLHIHGIVRIALRGTLCIYLMFGSVAGLHIRMLLTEKCLSLFFI
jgi:hypothetical protein